MEKTKFQELINVQSKLKQYKKQKKRGVNKLAAAIGVVSAIGGAGILGHQFMQKRKLQPNQRKVRNKQKEIDRLTLENIMLYEDNYRLSDDIERLKQDIANESLKTQEYIKLVERNGSHLDTIAKQDARIKKLQEENELYF
jgi:uncharacterized protein HemX